jgi:hypothetical protein
VKTSISPDSVFRKRNISTRVPKPQKYPGVPHRVNAAMGGEALGGD